MTAVSADPTSPPHQRSIAKTSARRRNRRTSRWIKRGILIAGALAVIGALVFAFLPKPVAVDVATTRRGPLEVTVGDDGRTRVRDRFVISAPTTGNLLRIELDPGAEVEAGVIVARILPPDPAVLDERSRAAAAARLTAALAHQRQADASIVRARVARDSAVRDADRARKLVSQGAVTGFERDQAELAEDLAHTDVAQAELNRGAAAAEVVAARAALGQKVGASPESVSVVAPARGKVLRVLRDSAGPVAAGAPLLELGDLRAIEVVVDLLSSDAAQIAIGAPASIEAWGGERALSGRVREVEPSAFTHISALGIEEQRVNIILAIDAPPPALGDGFRVEARIVIWRSDRVLAIPASAVVRYRDRWTVYTVEEGRAQLQPIDIGHRGQLEVEVLGGLADGAIVIVHPDDRIADGVRVSPR